MKLRAVFLRMASMKPAAWYIYKRSIQLCCWLLLSALLLLIAWDGDVRGGFRFYQLALTLNELAELALLAAVLIPPCVEDYLQSK